MTIRFACPCGQELEAEPDHAGMGTACPACHRDLVIPSASAPRPVPTAVRTKSAATAPVRPPLTNRFNDDGSLARPKGESPDDVRPRPHRVFDDDVHDDDHEDAPASRPKMRPRLRDDHPTGINWAMVGGGALVMVLAAAWAVASFLLGGIPVYQCVAFLAGLIAVVKGLLGHQRD
jgi:hypothetical protein